MRRALLASIGFLAATSIASAETLDGRWSLIAEECAAEISDGILTIDTAAGTLQYWESLCTMIELIPIGTMELVWQASMSCSGEGEIWPRDTLLAIDIPLDGVGTPRLIEIDMADGFVISRTFCGSPAKKG